MERKGISAMVCPKVQLATEPTGGRPVLKPLQPAPLWSTSVKTNIIRAAIVACSALLIGLGMALAAAGVI
jgi:hypothetical protein